MHKAQEILHAGPYTILSRPLVGNLFSTTLPGVQSFQK
jgi:hypothetical protein